MVYGLTDKWKRQQWLKNQPNNKKKGKTCHQEKSKPTITVTFCNKPVKIDFKHSFGCHLNAQPPAVVLSTGWTWLAVSRLSQHCALHMKQDMGLYSLGEFTSSQPSPPPLPHLPAETSSPFSWRPDIPSTSEGFSGAGAAVVEVKGELFTCAH